jgi:small subunit ribosomal protein S16
MPVKLRLARHGRKKFAFYHIVAADGRAPRDGKFIEKLGIYNPNTDPATIELDFEKSLNWLEKGAQPTETVRAILSYKGVLMKRHLMTGVRKGAFSEAEAEIRFASWLKEKEGKIQAKKDGLVVAKEEDIKQRLEAESKISEARAAEIMKKKSKLAEAAIAEGEEAVAETEAAVEESMETEVPAEEPVAEEPAAAAEAAVEESMEAEVPAEEPVAEEPAAAAEAAVEESMEAEVPAEEPKGKEAGKKSEGKKAEKPSEEAPKDSGEEKSE